jgi:hypothetical protein
VNIDVPGDVETGALRALEALLDLESLGRLRSDVHAIEMWWAVDPQETPIPSEPIGSHVFASDWRGKLAHDAPGNRGYNIDHVDRGTRCDEQRVHPGEPVEDPILEEKQIGNLARLRVDLSYVDTPTPC